MILQNKTIHSIFNFIIILVFLSYTPTAHSQSDNDYTSVEERRIYSLMKEERENLTREKKDLMLREKELKTLESSVDKKIAEIEIKLEELRNLQKRIETLLAEKTKEEKIKIKNLSTIYEKMVPGRAAQAISAMAPELATDLLANMKPKAAAKIMDMLDKNKSSQLSTTFTTIQIE